MRGKPKGMKLRVDKRNISIRSIRPPSHSKRNEMGVNGWEKIKRRVHRKRAIVQFRRGVDLAPDNAIAYFDLGIVNMRSGRLEEGARGSGNFPEDRAGRRHLLRTGAQCCCSTESTTMLPQWT